MPSAPCPRSIALATCACPAHYGGELPDHRACRVRGIAACLDENHLRSISITNFSQKFCINFHGNLRAASCVKFFPVFSFIFLLFLFSFFTCRMPLKPAPPSTPCASSLPLLLFEIYDTINFVKHLKLQSSRIPQRSLLSTPFLFLSLPPSLFSLYPLPNPMRNALSMPALFACRPDFCFSLFDKPLVKMTNV